MQSYWTSQTVLEEVWLLQQHYHFRRKPGPYPVRQNNLGNNLPKVCKNATGISKKTFAAHLAQILMFLTKPVAFCEEDWNIFISSPVVCLIFAFSSVTDLDDNGMSALIGVEHKLLRASTVPAAIIVHLQSLCRPEFSSGETGIWFKTGRFLPPLFSLVCAVLVDHSPPLSFRNL